MGEPKIKADPESLGASPASFDDDDIYEDAGDLEFTTDPRFLSLYLAKVPKYVWAAWEKLDDDAEIRIGTIRRTTKVNARGQKEEELAMLLDSNLAQHQEIPKEYKFKLTEESVNGPVKNTFLFTEKDLPGFKSKSRTKFDLASANMPSRLNRPKQEKPVFKKAYDPNKKFEPYFRKAIPKRTALAGTVKQEANCIVVDNDESDRLIAMMTLDAMQPKARTYFDPTLELKRGENRLLMPGTIQAQNAFQGFIKVPGKSTTSGKPQVLKTARMPENELLDRLFALFREFKYWPMRSLRTRLQQPEVYLKEVLDKIASLQKSGTFANLWALKPENTPANYQAFGEMATAGVGGEDSDTGNEGDGDDDGDIKFEDV